MSNYKKGGWSDIWDALFWNFIDTHFKVLSKEGRLGFIGVTYQKMSSDKKDTHIRIAREFLQKLENKPSENNYF
jgi:deoxyribodipyrimidine photolyase-related protein